MNHFNLREKRFFLNSFIFSLLFFLSLNLVSAGFEYDNSDLPTALAIYRQNNCINLYQICSNCTYNNISNVLYPNSNIAGSQVIMTRIGNAYNYSSFCNTSIIGTYIVNGFGDLDGVNAVWSYTFEITPSGNANNPNFFYFALIFSVGMIILGFSLKNAPITILGSFGLVFVGLYILLYGINGVRDTIYTWGWGIILLGVAGYIAIKSSYEMIEDI